jgi:hypothetical protein
MEYNVPKSKIMHMGAKNPRREYHMGGQRLTPTVEERDIEVAVSETLKPSAQCSRQRKQRKQC